MGSVKIAVDVKSHPNYMDWIQGWGVMATTNEGWHLASVHADFEEANVAARSLGENYQVRWGAHRLGSDEFVYELQPQKNVESTR